MSLELARGFDQAEFLGRLTRAQTRMKQTGLDALLLTTEPEIYYYTGFLTQFWESPTRPWFVIVPQSGKPIAVIPSIGAHLVGQTWLEDIRSWDAPDYEDDGIGLLCDTIREATPRTGMIGLADGLESHLRMPLAAFDRLRAALGTRQITSDHDISRALRNIKSPAEIAKITQAITIAGRAFDRVTEIAQIGRPLSDVFRAFQRLCLEEGSDQVRYLAGAAGQDGYGDVISPATDAPLERGDVLMLDTGVTWDGYFCDYDRNFSLGPASAVTRDAHHRLREATDAGFGAAQPGARISDIYRAMTAILFDAPLPKTGRLGHGLGMQLTEGPSIIASDHTILKPGMVLTLEPWVPTVQGKLMVHEENIVIEPSGPRYLSNLRPPDISVI